MTNPQVLLSWHTAEKLLHEIIILRVFLVYYSASCILVVGYFQNLLISLVDLFPADGGEFLEIDHDKKRYFRETLRIRYIVIL